MNAASERTSIATALEAVSARIARACARAGRSPSSVTLVAVSKGQPISAVLSAAAAGVTVFGENRVQEAADKFGGLDSASRGRMRLHLIGHLQSNKARGAVALFDAIESVDSEALARRLASIGGSPPLFIEVNVAGEPTKFGVRLEQVADLVARARGLGLPVTGLMTVAPRVAEPDQARPVFAALRHLAQDLDLPQLSMGMTDDFEAAILEGATHVRIGRAIFGERDQ